MRLSKDEKRLLAGYARIIPELDDPDPEAYTKKQLAKLLGDPNAKVYKYSETDPYENDDPPPGLEFGTKAYSEWHDGAVKKYLNGTRRVDRANHLLAKRGLIRVVPHQSEPSVVCIGLTLEGHDLGTRLSTRLGRADVWYQDHKEGIIGAFVGILFGLLGGFLSHLLIGD